MKEPYAMILFTSPLVVLLNFVLIHTYFNKTDFIPQEYTLQLILAVNCIMFTLLGLGLYLCKKLIDSPTTKIIIGE